MCVCVHACACAYSGVHNTTYRRIRSFENLIFTFHRLLLLLFLSSYTFYLFFSIVFISGPIKSVCSKIMDCGVIGRDKTTEPCAHLRPTVRWKLVAISPTSRARNGFVNRQAWTRRQGQIGRVRR